MNNHKTFPLSTPLDSTSSLVDTSNSPPVFAPPSDDVVDAPAFASTVTDHSPPRAPLSGDVSLLSSNDNSVVDALSSPPSDEVYVVCCTGVDTRFFNCEEVAIPLAICEERILAGDPDCEICALTGHIDIRTEDGLDALSLVQTSCSLSTNPAQSPPNSVFAPSSAGGEEHTTPSTTSDHHLRLSDPSLSEDVTDAPIVNNPYRKRLHFPLIYTPVTRYPSIKVPSSTPTESAGDHFSHFSCCAFCATASPPDSLATVDHDGLFMY